jgi:phosphoenolpyruvate synthase/pyruvate phosphate dikinase
MDMGHIQKGYLVAASFATGAKATKDFINNNHNKEITLAKLKDFPVNHPPSEEERTSYY